jgi:hypothetical protein
LVLLVEEAEEGAAAVDNDHDPPLSGVEFSVHTEHPVGAEAWLRLTQDMILPAFIPSLSLAAPTPSVVELGGTVTNPSFSCSYNRPVSTASITDGTNTVTLVSPFTSGTLTASYNFTAIGSA